MENSNSPLLSHLENITPSSPQETPSTSTSPVEEEQYGKSNQKKTKFRTDTPKYSKFSKQDRKLIGRIYESIKNYLPDAMSEPLITKIEEDLTK